MDVLFSILDLLEPYLPVEVSFTLLLCVIGVTVLLGFGRIIPVLKKSWRGFLIVIGLAMLITIGLRNRGFFDQLPSSLPEQSSPQTVQSVQETAKTTPETRTIYIEVAKPEMPSVTVPAAKDNVWDALVGRLCSVTASAANVRSGPGEEYTVLGQVYKGETYTIVDAAEASTRRTWFRISVNGQLCWISSGVSDIK